MKIGSGFDDPAETQPCRDIGRYCMRDNSVSFFEDLPSNERRSPPIWIYLCLKEGARSSKKETSGSSGSTSRQHYRVLVGLGLCFSFCCMSDCPLPVGFLPYSTES